MAKRRSHRPALSTGKHACASRTFLFRNTDCENPPMSVRIVDRRAPSAPSLLAAALACAGIGTAQAAQLAAGEDWRVTLDTTLSLGATRRMQAPAENLFGKVVSYPAIATRGNAA